MCKTLHYCNSWNILLWLLMRVQVLGKLTLLLDVLIYWSTMCSMTIQFFPLLFLRGDLCRFILCGYLWHLFLSVTYRMLLLTFAIVEGQRFRFIPRRLFGLILILNSTCYNRHCLLILRKEDWLWGQVEARLRGRKVTGLYFSNEFHEGLLVMMNRIIFWMLLTVKEKAFVSLFSRKIWRRELLSWIAHTLRKGVVHFPTSRNVRRKSMNRLLFKFDDLLDLLNLCF